MDSLFGAESPLAVRFFIAFIVVFALIGVTAWLVRRFGAGRLGSSGARGRAPRLAVIEAGSVDGRRKLVLIRRDNVEHLIMIGGPTDIVVEQNIVRAQSAGRETTTARGTGAAESLTRPVPIGEETSWPLAPEPAPRPARAARPAATATDESLTWSLPPEPAATPRRQRQPDTLAGLASELSTRPASDTETPKPRVTPKLDALRPAQPAAAPAAATPAAPAAAAPATAAADQNLADMAQRLEAALRRPGKADTPAAPTPRTAPTISTGREKTDAPAAPAADQSAQAPKKSDNPFGSLEEEMASLLGRPPGKP